MTEIILILMLGGLFLAFCGTLLVLHRYYK